MWYHFTFSEGGHPEKQRCLYEILGSKKTPVPKQDVVKEEAEILDDATFAESLDLPGDAKEAFHCC